MKKAVFVLARSLQGPQSRPRQPQSSIINSCPERSRRNQLSIPLLLLLALFSAPAQAKYSGGAGTPEAPYKIADYNDLYTLADDTNDYDKCFVMTADIDLDPNLPGRRQLTTALIACDNIDDFYVDFDGTSFTGTFDGNDCNILNLIIDASSTGNDYLGLFGQIDSNAVISNLGIKDANILSGVGSHCLGVLVGWNYYGSVTDCYATGTISGADDVGGLVGRNDEGNVTDCYVTGVVTGVYGVGDLVGTNRGIVTNCYATGAVTGVYGVGGLVGSSNGSVMDCYSSGAISGTDYVGGLVGYNNEDGDVINCYATCGITGNDHAGGLVGLNDDGSVTGSFWDVETSGTTISDGGIGLTTYDMQQAFYYSAHYWAGTTWTIDDGNDYPHLAWEGAGGEFITDPVVAMAGSGTAEEPWIIESKDDFLVICTGSFFWDKHYILDTDIDLSGVTYTSGLIGYDNDNPFTGSFDGNDHVISNLAIEGENYLGLFGYIGSGSSISRLGLEDVNTVGTGNYVGGLVGRSDYGSVTTCYATGIVTGNSAVGGLVGKNYNNGDLTDCYATGVVTGGDDYVGGLVGWNRHGSVTNCYSTGAVTGNDDYVGGLVGYNDESSVTDCCAAGEVNGVDYTGGLVGWNDEGNVTDCYVTGVVTGDYEVGGLVGWNDEGTIQNCHVVNGQGSSILGGGLVGWAGNADILDCTVSGTFDGAGLVGDIYESARISNCHVSATVYGSGGLIFGIDSLEGIIIENSGFTGQVISEHDAGGLVGYMDWWDGEYQSCSIIDCYVIGDVWGNDHSGGLVGEGGGVIERSFSKGSVTGGTAGGLVGSGEFDIIDSYSTSAVSGDRGAAGLAPGFWHPLSKGIVHCYAAGPVHATGYAFGLCTPPEHPDDVTNSYWDVNTTGGQTAGGGEGKTTEQMKMAETFKYWGCSYAWTIDEGKDYPRLAWEKEPGRLITNSLHYAGGKGTLDEPYLIETAEQFATVGEIICDNDKHFRLIADINLADYNESTLNPIGPDPCNAFTGTFDGGGHSISGFNAYLTESAEEPFCFGLFGIIDDPDAEIRNLNIIDCNVFSDWMAIPIGGLAGSLTRGSLVGCRLSGRTHGFMRVGGLVGALGPEPYPPYPEETYVGMSGIYDCHVTVNVDGSFIVGGLAGWQFIGSIYDCSSSGDVSGLAVIGGLVGHSRDGEIINSWSDADVNGDSAIGGLVGGFDTWNADYPARPPAKIEACFATGKVTGVIEKVGGLVGSFGALRGTLESGIRDSYSLAPVTGDERVAGLIGANDGGVVQRCYSAGSVTGNTYVGGLIADGDSEHVEQSFWDVNTSGQESSIGGIGLTTQQMKTESTFIDAGWDFNDVWSICETTNYPKLLWSIPLADMLCPDGVTFIDYSYFADHWLWSDYGDVNGLELSGNGKIENADFALFADWWGQTSCGDCGGADYTGDNAVDSADLKILFDNWLATDYGDCEGAELTGDGFVGIDDALAFSEQWLTGL